jgi:hypothetical protein
MPIDQTMRGLALEIDSSTDPAPESPPLLEYRFINLANTFVTSGIGPGSHTLTLKMAASSVVGANDFFNVTILELPFIRMPAKIQGMRALSRKMGDGSRYNEND